MTVRRRLIGCAATFLLVAFVTSAQAQQGRPLTTDEVKARLAEVFRNGDRAGPTSQPPRLPPNLTPEQIVKLAEQFGVPLPKDGKLTPEQLEKLRKQAEALRPGDRITQKADGGPTTLDPGKATRPDPKLKDQGGPPPDFPADPPPKPPTPPKVNTPPVEQLEQPKLPPEKAAPLPWEQPESPQDKARQAVAGIWEQNIGPLSETPAVQNALFDIVDGAGGLKDPDGNGLWDSLTKDLGDGKGLGDLFNGLNGDDWKFDGGDFNFGGGDWSFPKLNWNLNWGSNRTPDAGSLGPPRESWFSKWRRSSSSSSSSSSGSSWFSGWQAPRWSIGMPSLDGTWWPLLFVIAALVGGVFLWKWLGLRGRPDPYRIDPYALGPWPVDPHHLTTRQDVVVAFEHLSVLLCGPVAKTWTHTTIAGALSEMALAEPQRAMMLARLYELARYTPQDEPLTTAELAEARRLVCKLAGFSDD